jgi:hypothetical protein
MKSKQCMMKLLKKTYTNKRDLEIDTFFELVNWYKLLKRWGLFPTFAEASGTILELKSKSESIKKVWHNNPHQSLPQILALMGLLPLRHTKKGSNNSDWYFTGIPEMYGDMDIPIEETNITIIKTGIFGIRRKNPIYKLTKDVKIRKTIKK